MKPCWSSRDIRESAQELPLKTPPTPRHGACKGSRSGGREADRVGRGNSVTSRPPQRTEPDNSLGTDPARYLVMITRLITMTAVLAACGGRPESRGEGGARSRELTIGAYTT